MYMYESRNLTSRTFSKFKTLKDTKFKILLVQERLDHKLKTTISKDVSEFHKKNKKKVIDHLRPLCLLLPTQGFASFSEVSGILTGYGRAGIQLYSFIHGQSVIQHEITYFQYQESSINTWIPNSSSVCPVKPFCRAMSNDTEPIAACIRGKQINSSQ